LASEIVGRTLKKILVGENLLKTRIGMLRLSVEKDCEKQLFWPRHLMGNFIVLLENVELVRLDRHLFRMCLALQ